MLAKCDEIWRAIDNSDKKTGHQEKLIEILSNKDDSKFLGGDFSFSVMPYLNKNHKKKSFEKEIIQLRNLLWQLEDVILSSSEDEDFIKVSNRKILLNLTHLFAHCLERHTRFESARFNDSECALLINQL